MIRILHTADLHLDGSFASLGNRAPQRQVDFLETFERIVTLAIKKDAQLLLVAGDLFDHPRPGKVALGKVQAGLQRLSERGIVPVLLPGTHDSLVSTDAVYRQEDFPGVVLLDQPQVKEPVALTVDGQQVYLYGFAYRSYVSEDALEGMQRRCDEGLHVGLLHGSRQGSPEWNYRKKDLPFSLENLKSWGLDYVALGHYHSFEVLSENERIYACYPGSPEGKRFGENGSRYCALVTIDKNQAAVEPLEVNGRELAEETLDLSGCTELDEAVGRVASLNNSKLLLRLTLTGILEAPIDLSALQSRCEDGFFYLELQDETRLFDSDYARRIEPEETVRGMFVRRARKLMAEVQDDERPVIEHAFREVLTRFRAFSGGDQ
ncbi:hypothetical protein A7E78_05725 [Syntrophotalea acetylenivorans]|uniref:Calcineurin-like phosphoesterase domain-containing protein n=1 Tax=Syntrophotalea acetylenivorans TaxID=1842532 RepID=A0A1L3GN73_9BACT|nr:DNA repair exonuclease [Syntrophotalea acetylenivorans]APG27382.1 hypothetical protein A7E78_05725 [Syntrophotalea acetylenivorans]